MVVEEQAQLEVQQTQHLLVQVMVVMVKVLQLFLGHRLNLFMVQQMEFTLEAAVVVAEKFLVEQQVLEEGQQEIPQQVVLEMLEQLILEVVLVVGQKQVLLELLAEKEL